MSQYRVTAALLAFVLAMMAWTGAALALEPVLVTRFKCAPR